MSLAPHDDWQADWRLGVDPAAEERVAGEILDVFKPFGHPCPRGPLNEMEPYTYMADVPYMPEIR